MQRVYPRVCGGSLSLLMLACGMRGLSPRVRGKQVDGGFWLLEQRSIPACAGEAPDEQGEEQQ